jgi:acyl-CoA thioester hydrolase
MARHRYACSLRWSDMDAYGHVNNVAFLTYLEEARVDLLFEHAKRLQVDADLEDGVVVARHEIDYLAPLDFRVEPVLVETWVEKLRHGSFTLAYEVRDDHDGSTVYARARSVMVPFDLDAGRPRRLTEGERAVLEPFVETSP